MAKSKYTVVHPVEHDGVRVEAEEVIELEEVHAKPLLAVGSICLEKNDKKEKQPSAEEIIGSLFELSDEALGDLLASEKSGKNRKTVIEAIEAEFKVRLDS